MSKSGNCNLSDSAARRTNLALDIEIAASMMCANLFRIRQTVRNLECESNMSLHFDIMDGLFAKNIALGFGMVEQLRSITNLPFEIHWMAMRNDDLMVRLREFKVDRIAVRAEAGSRRDVLAMIQLIHKMGSQVGLAIRAETHLDILILVFVGRGRI